MAVQRSVPAVAASRLRPYWESRNRLPVARGSGDQRLTDFAGLASQVLHTGVLHESHGQRTGAALIRPWSNDDMHVVSEMCETFQQLVQGESAELAAEHFG